MHNPLRRPFRSRRSKIISGIVSGLVLVPVIAMATFYALHLSATGSLKAGQFTASFKTGTASIVGGTNSTAMCSAVTVDGSGNLAVSPGATGALPGDGCNIQVTIQAPTGNADAAEVIGLTMPATFPKGWTATMPAADCGAQIPAGGGTQVVEIDFTMDNTAVLSGAPVSLTGASVDLAPAGQNPTKTCSVTGTA